VRPTWSSVSKSAEGATDSPPLRGCAGLSVSSWQQIPIWWVSREEAAHSLEALLTPLDRGFVAEHSDAWHLRSFR
jgi:hypothetical protein